MAFVSGNALWLTTLDSKMPPHRLTESMVGLMQPHFSPDGKTLAFVFGQDLYSVSLDGGIPNRITSYENTVHLLGWKDAETLWITTNAFSMTSRESALATVDTRTGQRHGVDIGPCEFYSIHGDGRQVIQRQGHGYTSWKRYTGGTAGRLWIDSDGTGNFQKLLPHIQHNLLNPIWIQNRIYFLSDKEGYGNIYSCQSDGGDLCQHTQHTDFYPRHMTVCGDRLVYSCGGSIRIYDAGTTQDLQIPLKLHQGDLSKVRLSKDPATHLTSYSLSPDGKRLALTTRGRLFEMTPTKGPAEQKGLRDGVRYRWVSWFKDQTMVALYDQGLKEVLECYAPHGLDPISCNPKIPHDRDWGRIISAKPSPHKHILACTNHRHELFLIQLDDDETIPIATSKAGQVQGYNWSPCGRWIAYSIASRIRGSDILIYDTVENKSHQITDNVFQNTNPVFDPDGKYLFFLSSRRFDPQRDGLDMVMTCDSGTQPFVFILQENQESPFVLPFLKRDLDKEDNKEDESNDKSSGSESPGTKLESGAQKDGVMPTTDGGVNPDEMLNSGDKKQDFHKEADGKIKDGSKVPSPVSIDFGDMHSRILAFPLAPKEYTHLSALKGYVLYTIQDDDGKQDLHAYDLKQLKEDTWITGLDSMTFSLDLQWMTYRSNGKLRTVRAGSKPDDTPDLSFHQGGWLNWKRIALQVNPQKEWVHMFDEAWRLQKEMFWMSSMGGVDWQGVYNRYRPCIDQITCTSELYSVISDMQGELGTSHAYVYQAGDPKHTTLGSLGANFSYVPEKGSYAIDSFLKGDPWTSMPLQRPGLGVKVGDLIWAIGGQTLSDTILPQHTLAQQAGNSIPIVLSDAEGSNKRTVIVFPQSASKEPQWRYRQWVEANRQWVHQESQGKIGYLHIPDMQTLGYSEFLRGYTQEFDRDGLIIDVRYNGGGNLSYLMIDFLRRQRLGTDQTRHHGQFPYPSDAPKGPMVALINEHTGSDGDIFAHAFKSYAMGPLIGKRTWGGVVGIWPRYNLIDGTQTSQPEFSFWFHDMGWSVENTGVSPTIEVDITPQDYVQKNDPQLRRALEEALTAVENDAKRQGELVPSQGSEPVLAAPKPKNS